ncbi:hypothetical protein [Paenibacillus sp. 1P07SE]|uniref:hypothetical protein n=1 Tax=Paenibacillus sp. 1P07SE TaxID=3132209 RepID=UPI0039A486B1
MAGQACGDHTMRNGDAAFLQLGTEVYEMKGYRPEFRVIANNKMYEVDRNPEAATIGELWDIEGKVKRVSLSQGKDEPVGDFTEEAAAAFIKGLLKLRFVGYDEIQALRGDEAGFSLRIELNDGTSVLVRYYPEANVLIPGAHGTVKLKELVTTERLRIKDIVEGRAG